MPYSFEQKTTTMNQLVARHMKEFSDSLPASELEHLQLNMFSYFPKYICVHLHFTCNEEVFIQHTPVLKTSLKIEKKTSIEAQSKGHALEHKTSESNLAQRIDENESKKDVLSKARDFGDSNPVALERTVW